MDVVCCGIIVADVVARPVRKFPQRGKLELSDEMGLFVGGCATNTAIDLAKLGISTGVMGKVGKDGFGDFVISEMRRHGLNIRGVKRDPGLNTSGTMVFVLPDGERSFIHYFGANSTFGEKDVDYNFIKGAKIFNVAGFFLLPAMEGKPIANVFRKVKQMGITTTFDTAWDSRGRWLKAIKHAFPYVDVFLPSLAEAKMISGESEPDRICRFFLDRGVKTVGLKMGPKGSYLKTKDIKMYVPPYKVKSIDGTGAGDAFVSGFLAGMVRNWPFEKCIKLANAVGALATTKVGATSGVSSMRDALEIMKQR
ncbi:carbohydrate kinase [Candidatus Desantisbacteria bacterium CG02_land_8_20_14_3_00_49_13]|nr:MAG: carbohydrate kinase [Candidatus Desantisbacteria bacterium CG02_land_8_20_14_3_00_49_13]PJB27809.1 MAG: carbohydrate kinase [Candidatus Desantisbacteria bacterium CG_4_9_14_3_um_filter_50_7]